jgi:steroid 5-alpha reductase family enzyme
MEMMLGGAVLVGGLMLVLWLLHFPLKNAAVVDVGWTFGLMLLALYYAWKGTGWPVRSWLCAAMVSLWALRLGGHLFLTRVWGAEEEGRYKQLRKDWERNVGLKFLAFFLAQGLLDVLLSLPFLLICLNPEPRIHALEMAGAALWLTGLLGEATADGQLAAFKREGQGGVCQRGLWSYSRHPNYFFEIVTWVGFGTFALASPHGWLGMLSPLLIAYFILRVTGIPATEQQALRSKGEAYRRYQETTSPLIPWFKK